MGEGRGELIAADEPAVVTKPLLDPIVVENSQGDGRLAYPTSPDESGWSEVLSKTDYLLDQLVATKEGPWWWRWRFPGFTRWKYKTTNPGIFEIADLL